MNNFSVTPYAVYVPVVLGVTLANSSTIFDMVGAFEVFFAAPSPLWDVTGGIEVVAVVLGPGSSAQRFDAVVKVRRRIDAGRVDACLRLAPFV